MIEQAEIRVRQEILAAIDLPGSSARARLAAVLQKGFSLLKTIPVLQVFTGGDFDLLFGRLAPERLQQHLAGDRAFFEELIAHCRSAGIPIQAPPEQIVSLLYPLVVGMLHEDDWGRNNFSGGTDLQLKLIAAFCLGEVEL